jgi:hypothetical protein
MNTPYFPFWPRFNIDDQGRAVVGPGSFPPFPRDGEEAVAPIGPGAAGHAAIERAEGMTPAVPTDGRARRGGA